MEKLQAGAHRLGLHLDAQQLHQFHRYAQELAAWNQRFNLTAITDPEEVEVRHFVDSLSVVLGLPGRAAFQGNLVDIGTGAGFPGLPLKLALPALRLTLVESVQKKARFLGHMIRLLGLEDTEVHVARAEALARRPELREHFDVAVALAVGSLSTVAELGLPLCRVGGVCIAQKRESDRAEAQQARDALKELGGGAPQLIPAPLSELAGALLVVIQKVRPTPERYPRRPGIPAKRPL